MNPIESSTPVEPAEPHVPLGADYRSDRDFVDFPLSAETLKGLLEMGYRTATPVQASTIEPALAGRDLLVRAKTGTGKTVAFCVPIVERIAMGARGPQAIILAPTRELAQQIHDECASIAKHRDVTLALLVGGVPMGPQERALEQGAAIIVGTPGRVLDHLRRRHLDLSHALAACLDEADEMLSMGFYEDVTAILDLVPSTAQILLFSATIGEQTEKIIGKYLKDPENIRLSTDADNVEGIVHVLYEVPTHQHKVRSLLHLLDMEDPASAIIFCNTREDAATVASFLDRQGLDVQLLSGELPQARRSKVMKLVKAGVVRFLVATDVAARGIDISDLSHVIQYNLPQDPAIYLHRTGRTGRIGKKGTAIAMFGATDLQTRRVLEERHHVKFAPRAFPDPAECVQRRVVREIARLRDALGSIVFEAHLPAAKALMSAPDGEMLIAASLRAAFLYDRARRAQIVASEEDEPEAIVLPAATADKAPRKDRDSRDGRRDERKSRSDDRGERSDRGERNDRGDRKRRGERSERAPKSELDLDALLITEESEAPAAAEPADLDALLAMDDVDAPPAASATEPASDDDAGDEDGRKKRRRRRKKKGESDASAPATDADGALDDLLAVDDVLAPRPAKEAPAADVSDLDALLSMD